MSSRLGVLGSPLARRWALVASVAVLGGSCVLGNDTDGPVLAVDLLWDRSATDRFSAGTCERAGVLFLSWQLKDDDGDVVQESDPDADCASDGLGFNFFGLSPGAYVLEVEAEDEDGAKRWQDSCRLALDRFDRLYPCEVDQIETASDSDTGDAGPSDAGE